MIVRIASIVCSICAANGALAGAFIVHHDPAMQILAILGGAFAGGVVGGAVYGLVVRLNQS